MLTTRPSMVQTSNALNIHFNRLSNDYTDCTVNNAQDFKGTGAPPTTNRVKRKPSNRKRLQISSAIQWPLSRILSKIVNYNKLTQRTFELRIASRRNSTSKYSNVTENEREKRLVYSRRNEFRRKNVA